VFGVLNLVTASLAEILAWVAQDLEERHAYQYAGAIRVAARRLIELEKVAPTPNTCEQCGARFDQKSLGRPRRFCSERCRKRAGNSSLLRSQTKESARQRRLQISRSDWMSSRPISVARTPSTGSGKLAGRSKTDWLGRKVTSPGAARKVPRFRFGETSRVGHIWRDGRDSFPTRHE